MTARNVKYDFLVYQNNGRIINENVVGYFFYNNGTSEVKLKNTWILRSGETYSTMSEYENDRTIYDIQFAAPIPEGEGVVANINDLRVVIKVLKDEQ